MVKYYYMGKVASRLLSVGLLGISSMACSDQRQGPSQSLECDPFVVYAQNRWEPYGAAVREEPDLSSPKLRTPGFAPNEAITVDGYVKTGEAVYPTNPEPWDSDVWFRVYNDVSKGVAWVSFAGVRAEPSVHDETLISEDGGIPVALDPACEITL